MAASSPVTDPYAELGVAEADAAPDPYAGLGSAEADPYAALGVAEPAAKPLDAARVAEVGGDLLAEAGGATAGQMLGVLGGPLAPITVPVGGAIGGGIGNSVAQVRRMARGEQEGFNVGELIAAAGISAIPGGQVAKGATVAQRVARSAKVMGAAGAAGSVARQAIDTPAAEGELFGEVNAGQVLQDAALGALGGAGVQGAIEGVVKGAGRLAAPRRATPAAVPAQTAGEVPTEIQDRINAYVGMQREAPLDARLARQADADAVLAGRAAEATQEQSLLEARAKRRVQIEEAIVARDGPLNESLLPADLGPVVSPESQAWLKLNRPADQAEAALTTLNRELGENVGATRERARLEAALPEASPLRRRSGMQAAFEDRGGPQLSAQAQRMADEYGRIDPALLLPLARAAVGGVAGYATGDTPEERVQNALLGAGLGAAASPALAKRLASQVLSSPVGAVAARQAVASGTKLRRLIAPQSFLPREIRDAVRFGEQNTAAIIDLGTSLTADLEGAIKTVGNLAARGQAAEAVHDFLTGAGTLANVPAPAQAAAQKLRAFVDDLSDRAVAEGVVTGTLANTFLSNRGSYLRRSYEIFLNPDYAPDPAKVQAAISAVAQASKVPRAEAEGIVAGMLDRNQRAALGDYLVGRGRIAGKDVSSLVKRDNLLPEIRALLGEVGDPILAANQTILRLARLIENDAAQRNMKAIGQRLGLFSDTQSLSHPSPLVEQTSQTHDVLGGLYAAPDVANALQRVAGSGKLFNLPDALWKGLTTATSAAKMAKTVGNPESYAPNFIGGVVMALTNGNFRLGALGRGLKLGAEELGALRAATPTAPSRDALRAELFELRKLGLLGESTTGQDLLRTIESSYWAGLGNKAKTTLTLPGKVYGAIDDLTRYAAYRSELARYTAAMPQATRAQVQRHAAEVTRATMPTYSEIPKIVKQLSTAGLAPAFVNFTWEVFRNTMNTARIGARDLQQGLATGNAALRDAGAVRLASLTAALGLGSAYGLSKMSREKHGVDDDQDAAVRYFSPPWNKDGTLRYDSPARDGKPVSFSNLSYLLPQAVVWQALDAGRRGVREDEMMPEFLRALGSQFGANPVKDSVILAPAVGALTGRDPRNNAPIARSAVEPTAMDRVKYFAGDALKPLVVDWVDKMRKAKAGEQGDYGRVYSVEEQWRRLAGIREQTLDPVKAVPWKARQLAGQFNAAGDLYQLKVDRASAAPMLDQLYQTAEGERQRVFAEMGKMVGHARSLGVSDETTIAAMRAARLPAATILGVLDGNYTPLERDKPKNAAQFLTDLQAAKAEDRKAQLAQIFRDDPKMGLRVVERLKESAKGRTEQDKLLLSLGVEDGERARYLRTKLAGLGDNAERRRYLVDLGKKGVLTERVLSQMATP